MSAFVVSKKHVAALAYYAVEKKVWLDGRSASGEDFKSIYSVLAAENVRSVCCRYDGDKAENYEEFVHPRTVTPHVIDTAVEILKLVECLEYQSSEANDWKDTQACKILGRIRNAAINSLPGYDDAKWAID